MGKMVVLETSYSSAGCVTTMYGPLQPCWLVAVVVNKCLQASAYTTNPHAAAVGAV
jgi:hypothetical protein